MSQIDDGVLIPAGFASWEHAADWQRQSARAAEAIDCLWLQRCLYGLERALSTPSLMSLMLFASIDFPGFGLVAIVGVGSDREELGALQARMFRAAKSGLSISSAPPAAELEALRVLLHQMEQWSRERPGLLRGARALGALSNKVPVDLRPKMSWDEVARALGALSAMAAMERSQIEASTGSADSGDHARRL